MEKEQRNRLQKATQDARRLLEEEFRSQLLQTYDIDVDRVRWAEEPGAHLQAEQRLIREKLVAWIEHKEAQIHDRKEALLLALREMAFTALNRFVALKLMEARELVRTCVSGGLESAGFLEFTAVAQGLLADQESSYRLYLETIFEDVSRELRALFDPRDPASFLWPKRAALLELLEILNRPELAELWSEDETLGWVYQYFNGDAERKKMREESGAPRNSRELAVRNQFFTPRYVVEFLTDNTLGRIWYEMRQGNTRLKDRCRYLVRRPNEIWLQRGEEAPAQPDTDDGLSQEELLQQQVYIPHRTLKDPREIRMLDPACGSMHFGLYAFDLYLEIYQEAWEIAQGSDDQSKQEETFSPFVAYAAGVADKAAFLREVPRLILQHNIHGIDIDPRATQIARLTLWLRAQRAWNEQQLQVADRPVITRSNVVCAEPMPGEKRLLREFIEQQFPSEERNAFGFLLETVFDCMALAGEAGSLLRIEEEIRSAIAEAKRLWKAGPQYEQHGLFAQALPSIEQVGLALDLSGITDKQFWTQAERRIYASLQDYAERAEDRSSLQRRLFANDAAQGFAFIDICRGRYDALVMNPPFGEATLQSASELKRYATRNLYSCFIERAEQMSSVEGSFAAITDSTYIKQPTFAELRKSLLSGRKRLSQIIDLGWGVLDANVRTSMLVCNRWSGRAFGSLDVADCEDRGNLILEACKQSLFIERSYEETLSLPKSILGLNLPVKATRDFVALDRIGSIAELPWGCGANDSVRLFRLRWEVECHDIGHTWSFLTNGGEFSPLYRENYFVCRVRVENGESAFTTRFKNESDYLYDASAQHLYFKSGLTYPKRSRFFHLAALPAGHIFTPEGKGFFLNRDSDKLLFLAILNSCVVAQIADNLCGPHKQRGDVELIGIPEVDHATARRIEQSAQAALGSFQALAQGIENSSLFCMPWQPGLGPEEIKSFKGLVEARRVEVDQAAENIMNAFADFDAAGQKACPWLPIDEEILNELCAARRKVFDSYILSIDNYVSYFVGCSFGRWDVRYATGESRPPRPPDPFSSLSACSPGMLLSETGFPADSSKIPANYPLQISWSGILVVDRNHPEDIVAKVNDVLDAIWPGRSQGMAHEASSVLGVDSLEDYFLQPSAFFAQHLGLYSKSRRQAPIYWMLSAGNGGYSAWLYYHRFTQDTFYRVLRDFVEPRIQQAERELFELESQGALSGDAATRLQEEQALLQDLRIFKSELDLVAPLWNPNLNDGVIINHAILWRITPYTPWQKKCKECWDKLAAGDYDWAHLAFHLWPKRVIPKCTTDRSLAIAHGLEERLWQETNNGNWLPRQLSEADLQALIAKHSNPAVKSALERFLAAPPPVAPTRTRASRSTTRSTASGTTRKPRGSTAVVDAEATRQVLLGLTAAPSDGLAKTQIADLIGVEANALTAVIKQLKESGQIDQLGERRGARYVLSEQGRAAVAADAGGDA
jgi:hypothetical protein